MFFDIFFNNYPGFSQRCFFNSNFQFARMRSFHHIISVSKPKSDLIDKMFIENQLAIKIKQLMDS